MLCFIIQHDGNDALTSSQNVNTFFSSNQINSDFLLWCKVVGTSICKYLVKPLVQSATKLKI